MNSLARPRARLLLLAIVATHASLGAAWMERNGFFGRPAPPEAATIRALAFDFLTTLREEGVGALLLKGWTRRSDHTSLLPTVAALVGAVVDDDVGPVTQWITGAGFGALLALGTYRLARRFVGRAGALGIVALVLFAPVVFVYPRAFYWQHGMTCLLPGALALLLASDGFSRPGKAAAFGLVFGLATAVKAIAPLYVVASVAAAVGGGVRRHGLRRTATGVAAALATYGFVMGPWIATSLGDLYSYARVAVQDQNLLGPADLNRPWSAARMLYYPRAFAANGAGPVGAAVVAAAAVVVALRGLRGVGGSGRGGVALAADAVVAYLVATWGQVAGQSQYLQLFVVHGALAIAVAARDAGRLRPVWVGAAAAAFLYSLWVDLRPFDADVDPAPGALWGAQVDHYLAPSARTLGLRPTPGGEPWPTERFAAAMLADEPHEDPWLWEVHGYLNHGNLEVAARKRGRSIGWIASRAPPVPGSFVVHDPVSVRDPSLRSLTHASGLAQAVGLRVRPVDAVEIEPGRVVTLVRLEAR